jgi:hypothetical protein
MISNFLASIYVLTQNKPLIFSNMVIQKTISSTKSTIATPEISPTPKFNSKSFSKNTAPITTLNLVLPSNNIAFASITLSCTSPLMFHFADLASSGDITTPHICTNDATFLVPIIIRDVMGEVPTLNHSCYKLYRPRCDASRLYSRCHRKGKCVRSSMGKRRLGWSRVSSW